jgi:hypothetical protein
MTVAGWIRSVAPGRAEWVISRLNEACQDWQHRQAFKGCREEVSQMRCERFGMPNLAGALGRITRARQA